MKSSKRHAWQWRIALLILVAWISLDGVATITTAEVRPPRRKRRVMISTKDKQEKDETKIDIGKSLVEIAQRASRQSTNQMVDLVLVIDGSKEMKAPVASIERRLADVASVFEESIIDYQFALIWFQSIKGTPRIMVKPLESGLSPLEKSLRNLPIKFGDVVAGYGLDAIMRGLEESELRLDAEKHIVLATNSELKTSWEMDSGKNQVVGKILDRCKQDEIHINVVGIGEQIQIQLADETDGKWYAIDKNQRTVSQASMKVPMIDRSILKIEGIFRRIAQHIAATVKPAADIVFVFDSSLSMENKVDEICTGFDKLVKILDGEGLDYRFGVIRFWARAGGGESFILTTKPPLDPNQVKKLFRTPKRGDEHLLDAIVEGVPRLQTPDDRQLVLFIVTDESTSRRKEKGYTSENAIAACRQPRAQVYVIGGLKPMPSGSFSDKFQQRVTEVTRGHHYIMPGATLATERR